MKPAARPSSSTLHHRPTASCERGKHSSAELAKGRAQAFTARRPLAESKRGAGRGRGARSAYPRQRKSRATGPTVTTAFQAARVVRPADGDEQVRRYVPGRESCLYVGTGVGAAGGLGRPGGRGPGRWEACVVHGRALAAAAGRDLIAPVGFDAVDRTVSGRAYRAVVAVAGATSTWFAPELGNTVAAPLWSTIRSLQRPPWMTSLPGPP
jgi:hypothetical protein